MLNCPTATYPLLKKNSPLIHKILHHIFIGVCKFILHSYCSLTVYGRHNLPKGPFILCSNHNSHMDSGVIMLSSGLPFKYFGLVAAKDYFFKKGRKKGWLRLMMNLVPIDRKATRESIQSNISDCKNFLEQGGKYLIIYPEGTRSITGDMRSFKSGAALMAIELKLPVVPAYIVGTDKSLPKGKIFIRPKRIKIFIGKSIEVENYISSTSSIYKELTKDLRASIEKLKEKDLNGKRCKTDEMVGMG